MCKIFGAKVGCAFLFFPTDFTNFCINRPIFSRIIPIALQKFLPISLPCNFLKNLCL